MKPTVRNGKEKNSSDPGGVEYSTPPGSEPDLRSLAFRRFHLRLMIFVPSGDARKNATPHATRQNQWGDGLPSPLRALPKRGRASPTPTSRDSIHPFERHLRLCDPEVATANSPWELAVGSSSKQRPTVAKAVTAGTRSPVPTQDGVVLTVNVVPFVLRNLTQERIDLIQAAMRKRPLKMLPEAKHLGKSWRLPPSCEDEWQRRLPDRTGALLVRKHFV